MWKFGADSVRRVPVRIVAVAWTVVLLTGALRCRVAAVPAVSSDTQGMMYLARFGYLDPSLQNPSSGALISGDALKSATAEFQAFAGLDQTGILDRETLEWMSKPRCGVKDKVGSSDTARRKRYALQGSRWRVKELTYSITKYPTGLRQQDVNREVARAFKVWSDVTELTFSQSRADAKVHIEIRFESGEHGDGDPFDGRGGTLAHAYFPIYGGDAHFDDAEQWTINSFRGTNLFQVAAHEFGHSLGLSHSDVRSALMAPFYRGYESSFQLDTDDIVAIQALYGKRSPATTTTTTTKAPSTTRRSSWTTRRSSWTTPRSSWTTPRRTTTSKPANHELCVDGRMDTIFTGPDAHAYVFKGDKYWKLLDDQVAPGYPRLISADFSGLPNNLNAAFTWTNGRTYFFKGSKYWRFTNFKADAGYPKELSEGFAGVPSDVDTAFVWSGNGKIYFFKGSKYWRFDPTQKPPVKSTYPKDVSNWEGLPNGLDGALAYTNGYSYFFKDGSYWRFNDRSFKVDDMSPKYPRPTGKWWFGCPDAGTSASKDKGNQSDFVSVHAADPPHGDDRDADLLDADFNQVAADVVDDAVEEPRPLQQDLSDYEVDADGRNGGRSQHGNGGHGVVLVLTAVAALLISRF